MSNKTAVTQLFDIIKGVAQYSEDNPLLNQILMSEQRLLEIEKQQIKNAFNQGYRDAEKDNWCVVPDDDVADYNNAENYYNETYGGNNG